MSDSGYQLRLLKQLLSLLANEGGSNRDKKEGQGESYGSGAKEVFSSLAGLAGKGKDELIQSICREIGQATAHVLKEPLAQLLKDRKLQITIEFVPVKNDKEKPQKSKKPSREREAGGSSGQSSGRGTPNPKRR